MTIQDQLSELLQSEKEHHGSLNRIRKVCNVSVTQLEKYLRKEGYPRTDTLISILRFFDKDIKIIEL